MGANVRVRTIKWDAVIDMILRKHLTREQIARKVGVHKNTIKAYYYGTTAEPPYSIGVTLIKMSKTEGEK